MCGACSPTPSIDPLEVCMSEESSKIPELAPENILTQLQNLIGQVEHMKQATSELERLTCYLHSIERHPDYVYTQNETGRKQAECVPDGHGWEINANKGDNGVTRDDHVDYYYWRRLKSDALKDGLSPWDLKPIVMERVSREELLAMLREVVGGGYMPSSTLDRLHPKPEYLKTDLKRCFYGHAPYTESPFYRGTGYYAQEEYHDAGERPIWLYLQLREVQVVVNLAADHMWIRVDGPNSKWESWDIDTIKFPIDRLELKEQLEFYV